MSKTPKKPDFDCNFIPREIKTPQKDYPDISKTVFTHISNIHRLLNDWGKTKDKGVRLCRAISALKLHEYNCDYYPSQLKSLMNSLLDDLDVLKNIVEGVQILNNQLKALVKLQPTHQPVISTWSAGAISANVSQIYESLHREYQLKQVITENVAHCRDEKLIETYITAWELEPYFNAESNAFLFAEVGLTGVT